MPGGAWRQLSKICWHFWQKMNALEILSPEPVTLIGYKIGEIVNFAHQAPFALSNVPFDSDCLRVCLGDYTLLLDCCYLKC